MTVADLVLIRDLKFTQVGQVSMYVIPCIDLQIHYILFLNSRIRRKVLEPSARIEFFLQYLLISETLTMFGKCLFGDSVFAKQHVVFRSSTRVMQIQHISLI